MAKKIAVSIATWVFEDIVEKARPEGMGRSEWVEHLIIMGYEKKKGDSDGINISKVKQGKRN